jgi:hypothetical protein|tara:strand:+ start:971 stop:1411 length:441 start_codon:yes stop_codon:yes gene_type:complete
MSGYDEKIPLGKQLENLKYRWTIATKKYVTHYPDYKLGLDRSQYNRAIAQVRKTYNDVSILKSNLDGNISSNAKNLKQKDIKIKDIKKKYNDQHGELRNQLGSNKAAKPFKIQKYDENSKSYIFSSFYTISIFTLSFFIYKQLNIE